MNDNNDGIVVKHTLLSIFVSLLLSINRRLVYKNQKANQRRLLLAFIRSVKMKREVDEDENEKS